MTILIWCLFISLLLPLLTKAPVAFAQVKLGKYDNSNPRAQQTKLTGFGARALAGHQNAFEAAILFAPAVLLAIAINNTEHFIHQLAIAHIVARIIYHILYLLDISTIRSIVWGVATACSFIIIYQCIP